MHPNHQRMAAIINVLPDRHQDIADALQVSKRTLSGWLEVAKGRDFRPGWPGRVPPTDEDIARAEQLLERHRERVEAISL